MSTLFLIVICCGVYPLAVYGIARVFFPEKSAGSLILDSGGKVRGSKWMGQSFSGPGYFHPRPSSAGAGYDAANSSGSNWGPTSQKLRDTLVGRIEAYRRENNLDERVSIPADAVTASASGLDPHISPRNARIQAARVARVRHLSGVQVQALVDRYTIQPDLGILGEPVVAVLELNLALDSLALSP
jgi:K+-transporting ATPase ATPase C chain